MHSVGKVHRLCSDFSLEQFSDYEKVKANVLSAYAVMSEAYRQRLRTLKAGGARPTVNSLKRKNI